MTYHDLQKDDHPALSSRKCLLAARRDRGHLLRAQDDVSTTVGYYQGRPVVMNMHLYRFENIRGRVTDKECEATVS